MSSPYEPKRLPKEEYVSEHVILDEDGKPFPYTPMILKRRREKENEEDS